MPNSVDCTSAEGEWHSDSEIKIDKLSYVVRNGMNAKKFLDMKLTSVGEYSVGQYPLKENGLSSRKGRRRQLCI